MLSIELMNGVLQWVSCMQFMCCPLHSASIGFPVGQQGKVWRGIGVQDELSGADIKAMCTEAGLLALRERRMRVTHADFKKAKEKVLYKKKEGVPEGLYM